VERARPRVDDAGLVDGADKRRRAPGDPGRERHLIAGVQQPSTHAMVDRNDVADQPAAGEVAPWHETQCACRMGATSVSKTGGVGALARSTEQPRTSGEQMSARSTSDPRVLARTALLRSMTLRAPYGRAKPGRVEPETATYES
jgi:hypothetical protein